MKRFVCMHATEPGYKTTGSAQAFCNRQAHPEEWRIVAIEEDPAIAAEEADRKEETMAYNNGWNACKEDLLRKLSSLVPESRGPFEEILK